VIGSAGMQAEAATLWKHLDARLKMYEFQNKKQMSSESVAQLLSTMLYYKRFFPYYTFNLVAGLDEEGACVPPPAARCASPAGPTAAQARAACTAMTPWAPLSECRTAWRAPRRRL
jgi:20S proteasome alpha/beta subunit